MKNFLCLSAAASACAALVACGSGGGGAKSASTVAANDNSIAIVVDAGPANVGAINTPYVSVTLCRPGSSTSCQTIDHVIVDTGSTGLRVMASVLSGSLQLPAQTDASGNPNAECAQFADGYSWGALRTADVRLGSETAAAIPIQVIGDASVAAMVPATCSSAGTAENDVASFGGNGLLGVGVFLQDCGAACAQIVVPGFYYDCPATGCQSTLQPVIRQLSHPVAAFGADNNGVLITLPVVAPGGAISISGSLVFGVGTQADNSLAGATVFGVDANAGEFSTAFNGATYANSFIDSGSNLLYFSDSAVPACSNYPGFFCPAGTLALSATNLGVNGNSGVVNFSVANADQLFAAAPTASAFADIAAQAQSVGTSGIAGFDWGLPFFYGRRVFTAIEGSATPAGAGPYWAY